VNKLLSDLIKNAIIDIKLNKLLCLKEIC